MDLNWGFLVSLKLMFFILMVAISFTLIKNVIIANRHKIAREVGIVLALAISPLALYGMYISSQWMTVLVAGPDDPYGLRSYSCIQLAKLSVLHPDHPKAHYVNTNLDDWQDIKACNYLYDPPFFWKRG